MFEDTVVNKPWGYECQIYENDKVGVWYLKIKYGCSTSLHAHPNKKTGLIVLSGVAEVSFLNHTHKLTPPDKTMIRHGVFHSTKAISKQGLEVLEVETPKDKYDLVRLEDYYGRAGKPYEDSSHYVKTNIATLHNSESIKFGDCKLKLEQDTHLYLPYYHTFIILDGGVKYKDFPVLSHGDIVDNPTLKRLSQKFDSYESTIIGLEY